MSKCLERVYNGIVKENPTFVLVSANLCRRVYSTSLQTNVPAEYEVCARMPTAAIASVMRWTGTVAKKAAGASSMIGDSLISVPALSAIDARR